MYALLNVAFALLAGLLMTRIFSRWRLPDVTAFLVAGVLIGPFCLGRLGITGVGFAAYEDVAALGTISDVAMGFIAFAIGNEFRLEDLRKTGRQAFIIGIVQALVATALVDLALLGFHFLRPDILSAPAAITLGAIAAATAPAATLMVVRQYKAKGPLTSLLLPIVALDDAVGLVVFAVSFGIAKAMISGALSIVSVLVNPLIEIVLSLLLGMLAGAALTRLEAMFHSNRNRMSMTIAFVFLTVALAALEWRIGEVVIGFSPLLVCMMLGTVFCNICPLSEDLMDRADDWSAPLLAVFFVISGAELRLEVFGELTMVLIGVIYIIFRSMGKYLGAHFSAKAVGCDEKTVKYLGITLLPQAGVALGMCVSAQELGAADGLLVRNIVLFSVLIYELVGPLLTKEALTAAGEITAKPKEVLERRAVQPDGDARAACHLVAVPEQTEAGHIGAGVDAADLAHGLRGLRVERRHARIRRVAGAVVRKSGLERGGDDADAERLGQHEHVARLRADVLEDVLRVDEAGDAQTVFRLVVLNGVPAGDDAAGLHGLVVPALQNGADGIERKAARHAEQIHRQLRHAAHGVHV